VLLIKWVYIFHLLILHFVEFNLTSILFIFQFLTELDGVEILAGVFVFAATRSVSKHTLNVKNKRIKLKVRIKDQKWKG